MAIRIAIPEPSIDPEYNGRSLAPYLEALAALGAEPVVVPVRDGRRDAGLSNIQGVLLPGSRFDVDPRIYSQQPMPECGPADPAREAIDQLLLGEAFRLQKPVLAICYAIQALNVRCNGTLTQHLKTQVDHRPGREIIEAHRVQIVQGSRLASMLPAVEPEGPWVNSSHHQAVKRVGDNLAMTAISPLDGVVEAVELESAEHFVLGVQWHPERTFAEDAFSAAIFRAFVEEAHVWRARHIEPVAAATR